MPQDDIVHPNLTVFENLFYHAMMRLPRKTSKAVKVRHAASCTRHAQSGSCPPRPPHSGVPPFLPTPPSPPHSLQVRHVVHTLKVLRIDHIRDSLVGDASRRGVSGGQKKRVNIGMELVAMPAVCFMDEPTSGLDGAATSQLAQCLGQLRKSGLTIICVIHQPRYSVYKEFTHLLLLGAGGRQVHIPQPPTLRPSLAQLAPPLLPPRLLTAPTRVCRCCRLRRRSTLTLAVSCRVWCARRRSTAATPTRSSRTSPRWASGCRQRRTSPTG